MSFNTYAPSGWWDRTRSLRYVFVAGVVVGMALGWAFHGVISMAVRFGVVTLLLVPLMLLGFMWWRSSRARSPMQATMTVMRWDGGPLPGRGGDLTMDFERGDVVDLDDARTRGQQR